MSIIKTSLSFKLLTDPAHWYLQSKYTLLIHKVLILASREDTLFMAHFLQHVHGFIILPRQSSVGTVCLSQEHLYSRNHFPQYIHILAYSRDTHSVAFRDRYRYNSNPVTCRALTALQVAVRQEGQTTTTPGTLCPLLQHYYRPHTMLSIYIRHC